MTCSTWHPPRPLTEFRRGLYTDEAGWLAGANGGYLGFKFIAWRSSRFPCLPGAAISFSGPYGQIDHRNNHEDKCQQLRPRAYGNIAVLYQAHYASRAVEEAFVREQIPPHRVLRRAVLRPTRDKGRAVVPAPHRGEERPGFPPCRQRAQAQSGAPAHEVLVRDGRSRGHRGERRYDQARLRGCLRRSGNLPRHLLPRPAGESEVASANRSRTLGANLPHRATMQEKAVAAATTTAPRLPV